MRGENTVQMETLNRDHKITIYCDCIPVPPVNELLQYAPQMVFHGGAGSGEDNDLRSFVQVHLSSTPASPKDGPHRKGHLRGHSPIPIHGANHANTIWRNVSGPLTNNPPNFPPAIMMFPPDARRPPFWPPTQYLYPSFFFNSRGLYRWKSERDKVHYFVEFIQVGSVSRARSSKLNVPDTHIHALAYIPQLIDRFCALASAAGDPLPDVRRSRSASPRRSSVSRTRWTSLSRSRDVSPHTSTAFCPALGDPGFTLRAPGSSKKASPNPERPLSDNSETHPVTAALSPIPISLSNSRAISLVSDPTPRTSRQTLAITICEEPITVGLEELEDDPKGIISLLELSTCERDKWFIVAAHYRRGQNAVAAINVLTSMMKGDPPRSCFSLPCPGSRS